MDDYRSNGIIIIIYHGHKLLLIMIMDYIDYHYDYHYIIDHRL